MRSSGPLTPRRRLAAPPGLMGPLGPLGPLGPRAMGPLGPLGPLGPGVAPPCCCRGRLRRPDGAPAPIMRPNASFCLSCFAINSLHTVREALVRPRQPSVPACPDSFGSLGQERQAQGLVGVVPLAVCLPDKGEVRQVLGRHSLDPVKPHGPLPDDLGVE